MTPATYLHPSRYPLFSPYAVAVLRGRGSLPARTACFTFSLGCCDTARLAIRQVQPASDSFILDITGRHPTIHFVVPLTPAGLLTHYNILLYLLRRC